MTWTVGQRNRAFDAVKAVLYGEVTKDVPALFMGTVKGFLTDDAILKISNAALNAVTKDV